VSQDLISSIYYRFITKVMKNSHSNPAENTLMDELVCRESFYSRPYDEAFEDLREELSLFTRSTIIEFRNKEIIKRISEGSELRQGKEFKKITATRFTVWHPKPVQARRWAFNITGRPWMGLSARITPENVLNPTVEKSCSSLLLILLALSFLQYETLLLAAFVGIPVTLLLSVFVPMLVCAPKRLRLRPSQTKRIPELSDLIELWKEFGYHVKVVLVQVGEPDELCVEVWVRFTKKVYFNATHDETLN
jgi:hypothetical protein